MRMVREEKTVQTMIRVYCCDKHETKDSLCPECAELMAYAKARLANCPFQEAKTPCAKCQVHCYKPIMRDKVREIIRYSGPRMARRHPVLAFLHVMDGFKHAGKRRK